MSSSFRDASLESTYQRYSHWQRQKSLIVVNAIDVVLKLITVAVIATQPGNSSGNFNCPVDSTSSSVSSFECLSNSSSAYSNRSHAEQFPIKTVIWASGLILVNAVIISLTICWKNFADNYLHLAALATWLLMNFQGKLRINSNSHQTLLYLGVFWHCNIPVLDQFL